MKIGDKLYKYVPSESKTELENEEGFRQYRFAYADMAVWCNDNNATIEDKGTYVEIVNIPAPSTKELLQLELQELLTWFETYDEKCMQYQRCVRLGQEWDDDIASWDDQAVANAKRIKIIRKVL